MIDTVSGMVARRATIPGEGARPMGIVTSPDGRRLYVTTGRGGTVVALDAKSLQPLGSVKVGQRPWGLTLSPDGRRLYAANGPSDDVSVVDTERMEVVATVKVGTRPWGIAVAD
jgi:YVTN family beta-propeller protein